MERSVYACDVDGCDKTYYYTDLNFSVAEIEIRVIAESLTEFERRYLSPDTITRHACHSCIPDDCLNLIKTVSRSNTTAFIGMQDGGQRVDAVYQFRPRENNLIQARKALPESLVDFLENDLETRL